MNGLPVTAYECLWCPGEAFHYTPGDCRRCDKPLFVMGANPPVERKGQASPVARPTVPKVSAGDVA